MKQYLLFGGRDYYPAGGWEDFIASSDELYDLVIHAKMLLIENIDWCQIVFSGTGVIVGEHRTVMVSGCLK